MKDQAQQLAEVREQLRVAEAVRDDARAASARDLELRREAEAETRELRRRLRVAEGADDGTIEDRLKLTEAILEQNRLRGELARAEIARDNANDPRNGWAKGARDGWKKGVLETNDKLYAAKASGVELSWEKIFELINILLEHPP